MEWNQSNAIGLAKSSCTFCEGLGLRPVWKTKEPCGCVLRAIFRACYNRFRECADKSLTSVSLEFYQGGYSNRAYSRKKEEYSADFCLIARRTLEQEEYNLFRFFYLLRADHRMCQRRLNMDANKFHRCLRNIQEKLGRAYAEQQPYGIYPLDEYFQYVNRASVTPPRPARRSNADLDLRRTA
jgi:hypothetical protein